MPSKDYKNGNLNNADNLQLYDRLSRLHLEIASVYAELAAPKRNVENAEKVILINSKSGKLLANLSITSEGARAEAASNLPTDNAPYTWLKNYLKSMADKDNTFRYRLGEKDGILEYVEICSNITSHLSRKLESAFRWTFNRMITEGSTANVPRPLSLGNPSDATVKETKRDD